MINRLFKFWKYAQKMIKKQNPRQSLNSRSDFAGG